MSENSTNNHQYMSTVLKFIVLSDQQAKSIQFTMI